MINIQFLFATAIKYLGPQVFHIDADDAYLSIAKHNLQKYLYKQLLASKKAMILLIASNLLI